MRATIVVATVGFVGLGVYAFAKYSGVLDEEPVANVEPEAAEQQESVAANDEPAVAGRKGKRPRTRSRGRAGRNRAPGVATTTAAEPVTSSCNNCDADQPASDHKQQKDNREVEVLKEMRRVPIKMYMTHWCPVCTKARVWLTANGYRFTEYDVDANKEARRTQKRLNPAGGVPTLDIEGEVLIGFSGSRIERVLRQRAKRRLGI